MAEARGTANDWDPRLLSYFTATRVAYGLALGVLLQCLCWWAAPAQANEFDDFQRARTAYESGAYGRAVAQFQKLVGEEVPVLQNPSLLLESLKYLGASYLFLGDQEQAKVQFERLLNLDLNYVLDPLAFPEEVQRVFHQVKDRLEEQAVAQAKEEAEIRDRRLAEERRLRRAQAERTARLQALAQSERVEVRHSRLTALMPFGVGQFQNGHDSLGLVLAVTEGALLATTVATFALHERMQDRQFDDVGEASFAERAYRYVNQVSFALLALVVVGGIVDAQLRFQPTAVYERQRVLPDELTKVEFTGNGLRIAF